jgi:hypothetical protein
LTNLVEAAIARCAPRIAFESSSVMRVVLSFLRPGLGIDWRKKRIALAGFVTLGADWRMRSRARRARLRRRYSDQVA